MERHRQRGRTRSTKLDMMADDPAENDSIESDSIENDSMDDPSERALSAEPPPLPAATAANRKALPPLFKVIVILIVVFAFFPVLNIPVKVGSTSSAAVSSTAELRNFVYLTSKYGIMPVHLPEHQYITHLALKHMPSSFFNLNGAHKNTEWPMFTSIAATRPLVNPKTKLLIGIGNSLVDPAGFVKGARTDTSRRQFARNVALMVAATGADGVDIDWQVLGDNGQDYKGKLNPGKDWEIEAYPLLLAEIRRALGPDKVLSAVVPGRLDDMMAFTAQTIPSIMQSVDFLNVMTFALMDRRDNRTKHTSDVQGSLAAVDAYIAAGCDAQRINMGLAFLAQFFKTEHLDCFRRVRPGKSPMGCWIQQRKDSVTGKRVSREWVMAWHDPVSPDILASLARARAHGIYDEEAGGFGYWDEQEDLWWTFDTPKSITRDKFPRVLQARRLGGVFAWGIGEDGPRFEHFQAMGQAWKRLKDGGWHIARDEL